MANMITKLESIRGNTKGYWSERILSQLEFAFKMSSANEGKYDEILGSTVDFLSDRLCEEGVVTKDTAQKAEGMLASLSGRAKEYKIICAAHAHIDMNWMWRFDETVAVTLDTFRTMLNLMKEYPAFKFSQSQASVYKIVEEYDPEMLEEIKQRIKEGRWEVTASTWVETDKNMPNGESLARHILYTKKYLSQLLDIDPGSLKIDFEPDTFGHNQNVPEILARGGVKYYYHCRGYNGYNIYRWKSPSGNSVIVYREYQWYNAFINYRLASCVPEFCSKHGINTLLKVYGVGDHGGGPTRRDVEMLIEMQKWPVYPEISFGTFNEYFELLEKSADKLPVVDKELNFIFSGCYTTQTRIKKSNRIAEARLNEAEAFSSIAALYEGGSYRSKLFEKSWTKVLFNHFHDIITGSGVVDTREYAMGEFQKALAAANTEQSQALRRIASNIDTSRLVSAEADISDTMSEGAGVGYGIEGFELPQTERGRGKTRIFHVFNPSAYDRSETTELTVWDWPGETRRIEFKDSEGNIIKHQVKDKGTLRREGSNFWGHEFLKVFVDVNVPAYGYTTCVMTEKDPQDLSIKIEDYERVAEIDSYILENDLIKVVIDTRNAIIVSMIDKETGVELVKAGRPSGIFRFIEEDDKQGMTAWIIGRYANITNLNRDVRITQSYINKKALKQWLTFEINFRSSKLKVTVSLNHNTRRLDYDVECDWLEAGAKGRFIPQLNFYMPFSYKCDMYKYDIPFGTIERAGMDSDVPANSFAAAPVQEQGDKSLILISNSKYGFRCIDDSISLTLIRSSYDPDPYPELNRHYIKFAVGLVSCTSNKQLIEESYNYNHPFSFISDVAHKGTLPGQKSYLSVVSGSIALSAVKVPEVNAGKQILLRVYETEGKQTAAVIKFAQKVSKAWFTDLNEQPLAAEVGGNISIDGDCISFEIGKYSIGNICVEF